MSGEDQNSRPVYNIHVNLTAQNARDVTVVATEIGQLQINQSQEGSDDTTETDALRLDELARDANKTTDTGVMSTTRAATAPSNRTPMKVSDKVSLFANEELRPGSRVYRGRQEILPGQWRDVAVKLIPYNKHSYGEVKCLMKLSHQNIVQIYDAGEYRDSFFNWIYIVLELCSCNLQTYLKNNKINTQKADKFFKQIVDGLSYIHGHNITHRDLKPDNILLSKCGNYIKLSDFGISREIPDGHTSVTDSSPGAGADGYRPPESYREGARIRLSSDIFPLGIVSFYIFTNGKHPFGSNPYDWGYNIRRNQNLRLSLLPNFPEPNSHQRGKLVGLLELMLQTRPEARPTITAIQNHSYFKGDHIRRSLSMGFMRRKPKPKSTRSFREGERSKSFGPGATASVREHAAGASNTTSKSSTTLVLFNNKSKYLHRVAIGKNVLQKDLEFHHSMKENSFRAVSIGNDVYVLMQDQSMLQLCWKTRSWHEAESFSCHHGWWPVCTASTECIFVVGGSGLTISKLVSEFDPASKNWGRLCDMPVEKRDSTILVSENHLICFGGETERTSYCKAVHRMDLDSQDWTELNSMRHPRTAASAVEYGGNYYLLGGLRNNQAIDSVEMYDVKSGNWTELAPMLSRRSSFRSYEIGGYIFSIGGDSLKEKSRTIERYDVNDGKWRMFPLPGKIPIVDAVVIEF